jgi:pyridoxal phosphate enzyme (YggS family)
MKSLSQNLFALRAKIPPSVKLIAVSKTVEALRLQEALAAGQRAFGENYVQEAKSKWPLLREVYADIELHLIGHLQSNKAEEAVRAFDAIDTLDRPKLAHALATAMRKLNRSLPLLIEVNSGREPQKAGCLPEAAAALLTLARDELQLNVRGLMCIPPEGTDPAPYFRELVALARSLQLPDISMGMSNDFEMAIACGATQVRVGSLLFGARS